MKEKFYYLRKSNRDGFHRCGIVCLVEEENKKWVARGVALCNEVEDRFIRDSDYDNGVIGGLDRARDRAIRALRELKSSLPIRRSEALAKVQGLGIEFKSEIHPILSQFELKMLMSKEEFESIK